MSSAGGLGDLSRVVAGGVRDLCPRQRPAPPPEQILGGKLPSVRGTHELLPEPLERSSSPDCDVGDLARFKQTGSLGECSVRASNASVEDTSHMKTCLEPKDAPDRKDQELRSILRGVSSSKEIRAFSGSDSMVLCNVRKVVAGNQYPCSDSGAQPCRCKNSQVLACGLHVHSLHARRSSSESNALHQRINAIPRRIDDDVSAGERERQVTWASAFHERVTVE
eukprot:2352900-Amphidinium_carterae.2